MGIKVYDADQLLLDFEEPFYERDKSSITEQAGYVDAETQVKRLITAGANLELFRKGLMPDSYEYDEDEVPDCVLPDPTQDVGFDLADASQILRTVEASKRKQTVQKEEGQGGTSPESGASPTDA